MKRDERASKKLLVLAAAALAGLLFIVGCQSNTPPPPTENESSTSQEASPPQTPTEETTSSEQQSNSTVQEQGTQLQVKDIKVGTGEEAKTGDNVTVNYVGKLTNGKKFDSSFDRNQPFTFQLGGGQVIQGWEQGVVGMKVGGTRQLTIPPALGYGEQGAPPDIPPNATLVFEIQLLKVQR